MQKRCQLLCLCCSWVEIRRMTVWPPSLNKDNLIHAEIHLFHSKFNICTVSNFILQNSAGRNSLWALLLSIIVLYVYLLSWLWDNSVRYCGCLNLFWIPREANLLIFYCTESEFLGYIVKLCGVTSNLLQNPSIFFYISNILRCLSKICQYFWHTQQIFFNKLLAITA